jgi:hypothetical protein
MSRVGSLRLKLLLTTALLVSAVTSVQADWVDGGVALCSDTGNQRFPVIVSDGAGGAIVAWRDESSGNYDIYAQRVDATGTPMWVAGGLPICTAAGDQSFSQIVNDGAGGMIIAWHDGRGTDNDIYAQRVSATGTLLWTENGVVLCNASGDQSGAKVVSDGAFGAIVTWVDERGPDADIYAQRVHATGVAQWTANGVALCTAALGQWGIEIASDGAGGAIAAWSDSRIGGGDREIYAQRVDDAGLVQWTTDGVKLSTAPGTLLDLEIVSDDAGGAIVTWEEGSDVDVTRIDATGAVLWASSANSGTSASVYDFAIDMDGSGGVFIAWTQGTGIRATHVQRIDASGILRWTAAGVKLSDSYASAYHASVISDGGGGAIVSWTDGGGYTGTFIQRLDVAGIPLWKAGGIEVWPTSTNAKLASDDAGGAIVALEDWRGTDDDIYAQRITSAGQWGYPEPSIASLVDFPNDQGGKMVVSWDNSNHDTPAYNTVTHYTVWRKYQGAAFSALTNVNGSLEPDKSEGMNTELAVSLSSFGWEYVGESPAMAWDEYSMTVPTYGDSTGSGIPYCEVLVVAHAEGVLDFWASAPDTGYSVDNLSPSPPAALAAEYTGGPGLYLHWNPNTESDLHHYAIYRGATPDFVADEVSRIGTATDTSFVDPGYGGEEYYYKVTAIDIHENESPFALLTPDMISGVPGEHPRHANALFQNAPNPFLSSTRIAFSMKEAGHVRLSVFDAKGRLVRVLVDEMCQANHYVEQWDGRDLNGRSVPAGTYFYSLEAPGWKSSKKMTVAR